MIRSLVAAALLAGLPLSAPATPGQTCEWVYGIWACADATGGIQLAAELPAAVSPSNSAGSSSSGSAYGNTDIAAAPVTVIEYTDPKSFDAGTQQGFDVSTRTQQPGEEEPAPEVPVITYADVEWAARSAVTSLSLPFLAPQIGPNPANNEWNMLAVGYPIWLWTTPPGGLGHTVTQNGITLSLYATATSTTYSMGDGTTFTCWASTPYTSAVTPGSKSPDCGHTYFTKGNYTIQATTGWNIIWSALGYSGTLTTTTTTSTPLEIGELKAVVVG